MASQQMMTRLNIIWRPGVTEESVEQEKVGLQPAIVLMTSDEMKKKESGYYDSICNVRICIGK